MRAVNEVVRSRALVLEQVVGCKRDRFILLNPDEILYFSAEDGLVKAHTASETFWVNYQLGELEAGLPGELFFRARREVLPPARRGSRWPASNSAWPGSFPTT